MKIAIRSLELLGMKEICVLQEVIDCLDTHGQAMSVHGPKAIGN